MTYHLAREGTQLGTFEQAELDAAVASGRLRLTDLAWCEGMGDWQPLSSLIGPVQSKSVEASAIAPPPVPAMPMAPPLAMSPTGTSGMAITSLVLGIVSFVCGCLTGVPAILLGIQALKKIAKSGGTLSGRGIAISGMVCGGLFMIVGTVALVVALAGPAFFSAQERAKELQASNNARSIIIALKSYAGDHNGQYPDADESMPKTSNEAFRLLFKGEIVGDERVFGGPNSPATPDNDIGEAPDYFEALTPGENWWAMTKSATDVDDGNLPLLYQCPSNAAWPPKWRASVELGQPAFGSALPGGKVIIGRNDGSVKTEWLKSTQGAEVPLGVPLFDPANPREILMPEP